MGRALYSVASITCVIPMATISSKWLQSRTAAHTMSTYHSSTMNSRAELKLCKNANFRKKKKALCRSKKGGMATTIRGLCFPMAGSSIATNPVAWLPLCPHRALCPLSLLQVAPLKCALAQTRHCVPDSGASPFRRVNETACTHHCHVLTKPYAHHCLQNCSGETHQKFTG